MWAFAVNCWRALVQGRLSGYLWLVAWLMRRMRPQMLSYRQRLSPEEDALLAFHNELADAVSTVYAGPLPPSQPPK